MRTWAVIVGAGSGERLGLVGGRRKALAPLGGEPLFVRGLRAFAAAAGVERSVLAVHPADLAAAREAAFSLEKALRPAAVVAGGARRQDSVANALEAVPGEVDLVLVHDAARPFVRPETISAVAAAAAETGAAIAAVPESETVKEVAAGRVRATVPREALWRARTPQGVRRALLYELLSRALVDGLEVTDEAALLEHYGHAVAVVRDSDENFKITTPGDLALAEALLASRDAPRPARATETQILRREGGRMRIGEGHDIHALAFGRKLVLAGVDIPAPKGARGHSDADALSHAVVDAMLGAAALGDIGHHFPDTDERWRGVGGPELLAEAAKRVGAAGFRPANVDATVHLQATKLGPHKTEIAGRLAAALGLPRHRVNVKAKTGESLGPVGRGEAIAADAVVLLAEA